MKLVSEPKQSALLLQLLIGAVTLAAKEVAHDFCVFGSLSQISLGLCFTPLGEPPGQENVGKQSTIYLSWC